MGLPYLLMYKNDLNPALHDVISKKDGDYYQEMILSFVTSSFFPWLSIYLIIVGKNWKNSVSILLITHWVLKSIGSILESYTKLIPWEQNKYYPYTSKGWILCCIYTTFYIVSGILGDWYPLLRTKAVVKDKKPLKKVYVTCILHITVKLSIIAIYYIFISMDLRIVDENGKKVWNLLNVMTLKSILIYVSFITNVIYDVTVILVIQDNVFKEDNTYIKNSFLEKFKQISEYRIYYSMTATLLFIPFFLLEISYIALTCLSKNDRCYTSTNTKLFIFVRNINCYVMYIDQILIRYYYNKKANEDYLQSIIASNSIKTHDSHSSKYYFQNLQNLTPIENKKNNSHSSLCSIITYNSDISTIKLKCNYF